MQNTDYIRLDEDELPLQPNGFLNVMANLTRTGVFTYFEKSPDGTVRVIRQLRHPEEVFAETTLNTLMGLPATNTHPTELVSTENAQNLIVGMTSDTPKKISLDNDPEDYVQQLVTFFDNTAIKQIADGDRRELSLGYTCDLEDEPGEWNGVAYDFIQRDIKYNHLSLVDRARGGAQCKVVLDGTDQHMVCDGLSYTDKTLEEEPMKVFISDGKEFKVEDDVYELLKGITEQGEKAKTTLDTRQKEFDKLQANFDSIKAKLDADSDDSAKAKAKAEFDSAVSVRVALETKAKKILDESEDVSKLSDRAVKEKVVNHISPDVTLDGKSDAYVDARFDIAVEGYKAPSAEGKLGKKISTNTDTNDDNTYEAARKRAWKRDQELWKSKRA